MHQTFSQPKIDYKKNLSLLTHLHKYFVLFILSELQFGSFSKLTNFVTPFW